MSQVQCSRKIKQPHVLVIFILSVLVLVLIITWFFFCIAILKPLLSLIFSLSFYCFLQTLKFKVSSFLSSATKAKKGSLPINFWSSIHKKRYMYSSRL